MYFSSSNSVTILWVLASFPSTKWNNTWWHISHIHFHLWFCGTYESCSRLLTNNFVTIFLPSGDSSFLIQPETDVPRASTSSVPADFVVSAINYELIRHTYEPTIVWPISKKNRSAKQGSILANIKRLLKDPKTHDFAMSTFQTCSQCYTWKRP
jgi:hypothetical protein